LPLSTADRVELPTHSSMQQRPLRTLLIDCAAIFVLTAILIWPCFRVEFSSEWGSIESTFIADARLLNDSSAAGQWYPVWYAGTRTAYLYPPALRYGTAYLASVFHTSSAHAYHLFIGLL